MDVEDPSSSLKAEEIKKGKCLVIAAGMGNLKEVTRLLKSGVSVNAEDYNRSLFYASKNYVTPLQIACERNKLACVKILIACGADVNARDRFDVTAMHMAAERGHYLCLKELLDAGADCSWPTKHSKKGCYTAFPHLGGTTPLHLAAANNHVNCVKELIQCGADYNAIDERGRTSLFIASQSGFEECVLAHLKNAVGRDILSLPGFETGDTPLHFAVKNGMVECVQELLSLGSDPNHVNYAGLSPLHYCVGPNSEDVSYEKVLHLLVLNGFNTDVNLPDCAGFTPLHYVCFNVGTRFTRRPTMAQFLIAYGADPDIKNQRGHSIIEYELKLPSKDLTILKTVVQSMLHPPTLQSMKLSVEDDSLLRRRNIQMYSQFLYTQTFRTFYPLYIAHDYEDEPLNDRPQRNNIKSKCQWYRVVSSNPQTLQHYCRFAIRQALEYRRLRNIKDLPLPSRLQKFLLLDYEEPEV